MEELLGLINILGVIVVLLLPNFVRKKTMDSKIFQLLISVESLTLAIINLISIYEGNRTFVIALYFVIWTITATVWAYRLINWR